jgi:hypothetical protein
VDTNDDAVGMRDDAVRPPPKVPRALIVLWPAFIMAGVAEMLVFAVVDPQGLTWFGGAAIAWSRQAVYTVTFFIFWLVISTSAAITLLLRDET